MKSKPRSPFPQWDKLRQRLAALPPPVVEESIALRIVVQALVMVGIVATDVAAETQLSFWAIPLSTIGAVWSWHRRDQRNIALKFMLAIAMLFALASFMGNLLQSLNDTRIVLVELLVQVQVLHTFDLPRRKDLGYSIVIGIILMAVAATLSQTLAFGPFLLVFLGLSLPALVLDYRSRLGVKPSPKTPGKRVQSLPWRSTAYLFLPTIALGMLLFAIIPRVPGYQIRSLPVSATIEFQGRFDGRNLVSPLAEQQGEGSDGLGGGTAESGPGEIDEEFYYGFSNQINQNLRGEMIPKLVMRVRSQAEGFWRVIAFDRYTGQGWDASRLEQTSKLTRSNWTYRFTLSPFWSQGGQREVIQTYSIVSDLPSLIPALYQPSELYFPTQEISADAEGVLRSPVKLADGLTYSVISQVPLRDRTLLQQARTQYPEPIRSYYLQVPPKVRQSIRQRTQNILDRSPNSLNNPYDKALYLAQYLKQNYQIPANPLDLPFLKEGEDLVENFLFRCDRAANPSTCTPGGYADHFSTVFTVMLRSIGIPARLVAGYASGQFNSFTGLYEVMNTDAYAMTEVYFPQYGWFAFDPIPGHEIIPPSVESYEPFSVLRQFWKWIAGWIPARVTVWLEETFGAMLRAIAALLKFFFESWVGLFAGLMALVGLGFAGWLSWQGWQQWQQYRALTRLKPMERLYQQLLIWSADRGLPKHPAQTPLEYVRAARSHYNVRRADTIDAIVSAYVRWRYGGVRPPTAALARQLDELKKTTSKKNRPAG
jgi:transglutaminase-like putative cysteine protease